MKKMKTGNLFLVTLIAGILFAGAGKVYAHCDTPEGPVIEAAKLALRKGDVTPILKWVGKDVENDIKEAFAITLKVRSQGENAKQLADMYFFETLVRLHRAGEGESYTGIKPFGTVDPAFISADKALEQDSADDLAGDIAKAVQEEIQKRFERASELKKHADESVEAGRAYVEAYIKYIHFVETVHSLIAGASEGHNHVHEQGN
jgi:hypothetical protein